MPEPVVLDPNLEFADAPDPKDDLVVTPVVKDAPIAATAAEVAELRQELAKSLKQVEALSSETAVVGKLKELFTGTPEDPKDAFVKKEIQRLVPDLSDIAKINFDEATLATLNCELRRQ